MSYPAIVRPVVDRVYGGLRAAGRDRGRLVMEKYGLDPQDLGLLPNFYFAILARPISAEGLAAVTRYYEAAQVSTAVSATVEHGLVVVDAAGAMQLTELGHGVLTELQDAIAAGAEQLWTTRRPALPGLAALPRLNDLVARLLVAGKVTGGAAFTAMSPPYEPPGASEVVLFCNRLGSLRHHRSDAHAAAWSAAGLTAPDILKLTAGPTRQAIEDETNRLDAPIYDCLSDEERWELLASLGALPG